MVTFVGIDCTWPGEAACPRSAVPCVARSRSFAPGGPSEGCCAGAATGVVEYADILSPDRIREGDVILGLASSGLHSNGYSLVRRVIAHAGWALDREVAEFGRTLGEELLTPTRVYAADLVDLLREPSVVAGGGVHGLSHVTGGGLAANLARVLPQGLHARVDRATWTPPAVFATVQSLGNVPQSDIERTLNQGVGFVALVPADAVGATTAFLDARGIPTWVMGQVHDADRAPIDPGHEVIHGAKGVDGGSVQLVGVHR